MHKPTWERAEKTFELTKVQNLKRNYRHCYDISQSGGLARATLPVDIVLPGEYPIDSKGLHGTYLPRAKMLAKNAQELLDSFPHSHNGQGAVEESLGLH